MAYHLKFISSVIYKLKRRYGVPLTLYKRGIIDNEVDTGIINITWDRYKVRQAIVYPTKWQKDFVYDLAYIMSSGSYTYGGLYEQDLRRIIIDTKDLPKGVEWTNNDMLVFEGHVYELKEVHIFQNNRAALFMARATNGHEPGVFIKENVDEKIQLTHEATVIVS